MRSLASIIRCRERNCANRSRAATPFQEDLRTYKLLFPPAKLAG
jgi:hypothetical protein